MPMIFLFKQEKSLSFNDVIKKIKGSISPRTLSKTIKTLLYFKIIEIEENTKKKTYIITKEGKKIERWLKSLSTYLYSNDYKIPSNCQWNCSLCDSFKTH